MLLMVKPHLTKSSDPPSTEIKGEGRCLEYKLVPADLHLRGLPVRTVRHAAVPRGLYDRTLRGSRGRKPVWSYTMPWLIANTPLHGTNAFMAHDTMAARSR